MLRGSVESAIRACSKLRCKTEIMIVLDAADEVTTSVARDFADECHILNVEFEDLGLSRNFGVNASSGKYISFLDGDDLWSSNWLYSALEYRRALSEPSILHPELNVFFNDRNPTKIAPITRNIDADSPLFNLAILAQANFWTALSFSDKEVYLQFPFRAVTNDLGNGFEDWAFNLETSLGGVTHHTVPKTLHCIRDKKNGSMRRRHAARNAIFYPVNFRLVK